MQSKDQLKRYFLILIRRFGPLLVLFSEEWSYSEKYPKWLVTLYTLLFSILIFKKELKISKYVCFIETNQISVSNFIHWELLSWKTIYGKIGKNEITEITVAYL